jgi:hypothetical protein
MMSSSMQQQKEQQHAAAALQHQWYLHCLPCMVTMQCPEPCRRPAAGMVIGIMTHTGDSPAVAAAALRSTMQAHPAPAV